MGFDLLKKIEMIEMTYHIGLTFVTLAFIYLFYAVIYSNKSYKIPKQFLLLYGIGGIFLFVKNSGDGHTYIAINEFIGSVIALSLYFYM